MTEDSTGESNNGKRDISENPSDVSFPFPHGFSPPLIILERVDSTNTYAKDNFHSLADGTVVAAVEQFAGRGRLGRKWVSDKDASLAATAVFKNILKPFHAGAITGLAGLELIRESLPGEPFFFKWPNDIYLRNCKISGILSEGVVSHGRITGVVSGIGININQTAGELAALDNPAVSMFSVSGEKFFVEKLRFELAEKIKKYYIIYKSCPGDVIDLWRQENRLVGRELILHTPSGEVKRGCFTGIGEEGEMILLDPDGRSFRFNCGDVKINTSEIGFDN